MGSAVLNDRLTKEMQSYCSRCRDYVAQVGCGKGKTPAKCHEENAKGKTYQTKEMKCS